MTVEVPTYVPPKQEKKKPPERVSEAEAKKILHKRIEDLMKRPKEDWDASASLIWIDERGDGQILHSWIMEKNSLQRVTLEVMKTYGLDENKHRGGISQDSDPIDFKIVRGSFTEYQDYPTRFKDLFFHRVVRTEGRIKYASWDVRKSSVYYPESMP